MPRDSDVYLDDIREAVGKIQRYTRGLSREAFAADEKTVDAVVRNLEIIGEAAKNLDAGFRGAHPGLDWRKIAGLRDVLAHEYFGIDLDIVWDIVQNKIPELAVEIDDGPRT